MAGARRVHPTLLLAVLASGGTVVAFQFTLVIPPLGRIAHDLAIPPDDASWIITATLLSSAVGTPIVSRLADLYGKRRFLIVTLICLILGSLVAAIGGTFPMLVLGRAISGVAVALMPIGISILRDHSTTGKIGGPVALMSATMAIGNSLALPFSGLIAEYFGWRMLFWIMCTLGALMLVGVFLVVPADRGYATNSRFDYLGAVVLSVALVAALLVVSKGSAWGWLSPATIGCAAVAVVLFVFWVPWELRVTQPMVDLRTAVIRPVLLTNSSTFFVAMAMFANMLMTTQLVQVPVELGGLGGTPLQGGLAMVPATAVMLLIAPFSGRLLDRVGGRPVLIAGAVILAAAYVVRLFWHDTALAVVVGSTVVGLGSALAFAATPVLIMSAVPLTQTTAANGINALVRSFGTAICSGVAALLTTMFTVSAGGDSYPGPEAFNAVFLMAAITSVAAAALAIALPRNAAQRLGESDDDLIQLHGSIDAGDRTQLGRPAVVNVLTLDGQSVDWSRADNSGSYAAVVPKLGRYVIVANASGWSPRAVVVDVTSDSSRVDISLLVPLSVSGVVTEHGSPVADAKVALHHVDGSLSAEMQTDEQGRYDLPLPPVGNYIVTAIAPGGRWAESRKRSIGLSSESVELAHDER